MHQNVYDKALAIFQEGTKNLAVRTKAIDRERIQSTIQHKLEERKVKQDLLTMIKEKNRLENESKDFPVLRREKSFAGIETLKKRKTLQTRRSMDCFPSITCTTANVPKIMRRNLSNESEFYNWLTGLPKIGNRSIIALQPVARTHDDKADPDSPRKSSTDLPPPPNKTSEVPTEDSRRYSKVSNIVYSVPLFRGEDRKLVKSNRFPVINNNTNLQSRMNRKTDNDSSNNNN